MIDREKMDLRIIDDLQERNAKLVAALLRYGFHDKKCSFDSISHPGCDCGFDEALAYQPLTEKP